MKTQLTKQEQRFVEAFLEGNSPYDAYLAAGYAEAKLAGKTREKARRILKRPHIQEAMKRIELERLQAAEPTVDNVKRQFMRVYELAVAINDLAVAARALEGLTKVFSVEEPQQVLHQHLHATISPKRLQEIDREIARLQDIIELEDQRVVEGEFEEVTDG